MLKEKKVKIARFPKDPAGIRSLRKRRARLNRGMIELPDLCDVMADLAIYNPEETTPRVWQNNDVTRPITYEDFEDFEEETGSDDQEMGQEVGGNSGYGRFRYVGLTINKKGKVVVGQSSLNPNMNSELLFSYPPELSYANLVLGRRSSYGKNKRNNAVYALNSGWNLGLNSALDLSLNIKPELQLGHPGAGTSSENQTLGKIIQGELSGMFRGETSGTSDEKGLDHEGNQTSPNSDNSHQ